MQIIYQQIIKEIVNYLEPFKDYYSKQRFEFNIRDFTNRDDDYQIDIIGYYKDEYEPEKQTKFILLRLYISWMQADSDK